MENSHEAERPPVTVVVATRDRRESLLRSLARLDALPERPALIVVDNGSSDGTPDAVRSAHPRALVLEAGANLGAAARTAGAESADTEYVAFSDDDSWWAPGALARAAAVLDAHPRLAVLAARILVGDEQREDPVCAEMARSPLRAARPLPGPPVLGFVACGSVVRRSPFLAAGGFHPRLGIGGEEQLLALDLALAGWSLAYVAGVVAHHHPSSSRDPRRRREVELRNAVWTAWLRRPLPGALSATLAVARKAAAGDRAARGGLREALAGAVWVVSERRVLPRELERALRDLDA